MSVSLPHAALAPVPVCNGRFVTVVLCSPQFGFPAGSRLQGTITNKPQLGQVMGVIVDRKVALGYVVNKNNNLYLCQFGLSPLPIPPGCQLVQL